MRSNPWFGDFPLALAKGQSLTIAVEQFPADLAVVRKIFFLPLEHGRNEAILRIGATWEWDDLTPTPTAEGRERLETLVRRICPHPFRVLDQSAGVRPITKDKKPLVGTLPGRRHLAVLNGLGSKGSLLAPYFAQRLLRHLEAGEALPEQVDPCRNLG
jgi:glycine/D-amino acid oxidase-like deaminating enzyme